MNVSLPPKLRAFVQAKIRSGLYNDAGDVLREALRLMQARDRGEREKLRRLRAALVAGEESGQAEPFDMEHFIAELDAEPRKQA